MKKYLLTWIVLCAGRTLSSEELNDENYQVEQNRFLTLLPFMQIPALLSEYMAAN